MVARKPKSTPKQDYLMNHWNEVIMWARSAREIEIRRRLNVSQTTWDTFRRNHPEEWAKFEHAKDDLIIKLEDKFIEQCLKPNPNPAILIFAMKAVCGWREEPRDDSGMNANRVVILQNEYTKKRPLKTAI